MGLLIQTRSPSNAQTSTVQLPFDTPSSVCLLSAFLPLPLLQLLLLLWLLLLLRLCVTAFLSFLQHGFTHPPAPTKDRTDQPSRPREVLTGLGWRRVHARRHLWPLLLPIVRQLGT